MEALTVSSQRLVTVSKMVDWRLSEEGCHVGPGQASLCKRGAAGRSKGEAGGARRRGDTREPFMDIRSATGKRDLAGFRQCPVGSLRESAEYHLRSTTRDSSVSSSGCGSVSWPAVGTVQWFLKRTRRNFCFYFILIIDHATDR